MELVAPRESEIAAAVAQLCGRDAGTFTVVEGLACRITRDAFARAYEKLERRRASGSVREEASLFVHLLQVELLEGRRAEAEANVAAAVAHNRPAGIERLKREDPERYIRAMVATWPGFDVDTYLNQYVSDAAERHRLARLAASLRRAA